MSPSYAHPAGEATARRLVAARALGGFKSVLALAQAMDFEGLRESTLRRVELAGRGLWSHEAEVIAETCGVPAAFFEADFFASRPADPVEVRLEAVERRLAIIERLEASR